MQILGKSILQNRELAFKNRIRRVKLMKGVIQDNRKLGIKELGDSWKVERSKA